MIGGWSGGVFRHRVSEFVIELQLIRNWKGRRGRFLQELINCMGDFDELKLNAINSCRKFELDGRELIAAENSPSSSSN